jgi:response regulator RpfG family c-di-GMP phosphodiesterase
MKKQVTVLYVDDEEINLFLFERSFNSMYRVLTAQSGEAGLVKLGEYPNDIIVVITDMRMPGMDGIAFIRKAKEQFNNIAYYVLTAFNHNDEINKAIEEKLFDKFFIKPFDIEAIKLEIDRVASTISL